MAFLSRLMRVAACLLIRFAARLLVRRQAVGRYDEAVVEGQPPRRLVCCWLATLPCPESVPRGVSP